MPNTQWFHHDDTEDWGYFALCYSGWHIAGRDKPFPIAWIQGTGSIDVQLARLAGEATQFIIEGEGDPRWVEIYQVDADGSIADEVIRIDTNSKED